MKTHTQLVNYFFKNKGVLENALGLPYVWIRDKEFVIDRSTNERADLVFQDAYDPYKVSTDITCFALEVKKDKGDHEILGQLKKYIEVLENVGSATKHWGKVRGLSAAHNYTESGIRLLWKENFNTFLIREKLDDSICLEEVKMKRKACFLTV